MGFRFRKSKSFGPFRVNVSKTGIGWSVGTKAARYTKRADGKKQTTLSIPGTGLSYVDIKGSSKNSIVNNNVDNNNNASNDFSSKNNKPNLPLYKRKWFIWLTLFLFPPIGILLLWLHSGYKKAYKIILSLFFGIIFIAALATSDTKEPLERKEVVTSESAKIEEEEEPKVEEKPILTGWQNENDKYYYYDNDGIKKTGWVQDNNQYYYFNSLGVMQQGWIQDKGNWYYMNDNGTMATNTTIDDYIIASNGIATKKVVENTQSAMQDNTKSNEKKVYIAGSGKGKKYHSNSSCSKMKGAISITIDEAKQRGYTPCSKC